MRVTHVLCLFLAACAQLPKEAYIPKNFQTPVDDKENPISDEMLYETIHISHDKHKETYFFKSKRQDAARGLFHMKDHNLRINPYLGLSEKHKSKPYTIIEWRYQGDGWIFFNFISLICEEPKAWKEKITFRGTSIKRDVIYGAEVAEYVHQEASDKLLEKLSKCEKLSVRFSGKYFSEGVFSKKDKVSRALLDSLKELAVLREKLSKSRGFIEDHRKYHSAKAQKK